MLKIRLDQLLVQRELTENLAKAQAIIMAGKILVNEQKITKAGHPVLADAVIRILGEQSPYVSRGGLKLAGALKSFNFDPTGLVCLDIGASTGGFTDCLLQKGADRVIALDVGHNQLDWKIRSNNLVVVIEKCNFRYLTKEKFDELVPPLTVFSSPEKREGVSLAVVDVSFISLDKILDPLYNILEPGGYVVSLVKPQFEAKREQVGQGGIIEDPQVHQEVMVKTKKLALSLGYEYLADDVSAIKGADGNKEYFIFLRKPNA